VATGLIEALAVAAKRAREDAGVTRSTVAAKVEKTEDTIRKFEDGRTFTALNDLISAYEDTTGVSLMDLLSEAEEILKRNGSPS
jgi:ribosome-binding protein aMBF1 (putative translation factor)